MSQDLEENAPIKTTNAFGIRFFLSNPLALFTFLLTRSPLVFSLHSYEPEGERVLRLFIIIATFSLLCLADDRAEFPRKLASLDVPSYTPNLRKLRKTVLTPQEMAEPTPKATQKIEAGLGDSALDIAPNLGE